ncbi:hypothetical protein B0H13DRAFT_2651174 [Mycena leptocephala]|nr:hypothetical protein B0H13DRAFT_2651174 [Mycena leptocephala]
MSSLPELEACLSILPSALPAPSNTTTNTTILFFLVIFVTAGIMHYVSPPCLTRVLVTAIAHVEKTYLDALETSLLSVSDIDTAEMLSSLQLKGHTFTLLGCIREVRVLETHIEILKETQLRQDNLHPFADRVRSVCLRRRNHSPSYNV